MLPEFFKEKYFGVCQDYYEKLKKECTKCEHLGHIMKDEQTYVDCDCTKAFLKNKEYIKIGVPVVLFNGSNGKFVETFTKECQENVKLLIKMIRQLTEATNIFIHCKERKDYATSFIASLIAVNLIDSEHDVAMIKSHELIDTFFNFERDEKGWDSLVETKFLIVDGFGQENNKQLAEEESFVTTRFMNFLNLRSSMNCITIIVGDLIVDDLKKKYCTSLIEYFVLECLKFEVSIDKKKQTALERLSELNPEFAKLFSDKKVSSSEGESVRPVSKQRIPNRGRTL